MKHRLGFLKFLTAGRGGQGDADDADEHEGSEHRYGLAEVVAEPATGASDGLLVT
jgi:hypothetical protein